MLFLAHLYQPQLSIASSLAPGTTLQHNSDNLGYLSSCTTAPGSFGSHFPCLTWFLSCPGCFPFTTEEVTVSWSTRNCWSSWEQLDTKAALCWKERFGKS